MNRRDQKTMSLALVGHPIRRSQPRHSPVRSSSAGHPTPLTTRNRAPCLSVRNAAALGQISEELLTVVGNPTGWQNDKGPNGNATPSVSFNESLGTLRTHLGSIGVDVGEAVGPGRSFLQLGVETVRGIRQSDRRWEGRIGAGSAIPEYSPSNPRCRSPPPALDPKMDQESWPTPRPWCRWRPVAPRRTGGSSRTSRTGRGRRAVRR